MEWDYSSTSLNRTEYEEENWIVSCPEESNETFKSGIFGTTLAVPELQAILIVLPFSLIPLITTFCYVLVILSVFTYKPLRIVENFYIVSLAVADVALVAIVLPFDVAFSLKGRWVFGIHACKVWLTCDTIGNTASKLHLCVIALDRYLAITDPIAYAQKRTLRRTLFIIGAVWLVSLALSAPPLVGWSEVSQYKSGCDLITTEEQTIFISLTNFIPLFLMSIMYAEIYLGIRKRLRDRDNASKVNTAKAETSFSIGAQLRHRLAIEVNVRNRSSDFIRDSNDEESSKNVDSNSDVEGQSTPPVYSKDKVVGKCGKKLSREGLELRERNNTTSDPCKGNGVKTAGGDIGTATPPEDRRLPSRSALPSKGIPNASNQFVKERQKISLSKERKATRTLGFIMGTLVICWLPYSITYIVMKFCDQCCVPHMLMKFIAWLGYTHSALNPIIYTIFNLEFRRAFKKLLHIKR